MEPHFILPQHPKTSSSLSMRTVLNMLARGWVGQFKMNGRRCQVHISSDGEIASFTRQGTLHTLRLSQELLNELKHYQPAKGWNVIEGEWIPGKNQLHLFDILKSEGDLLSGQTYGERFKLLSTMWRLSPTVKLLRPFKTRSEMLKAIELINDSDIEGLVWKAWNSPGWPDSSIVRSRKKDGGDLYKG